MTISKLPYYIAFFTLFIIGQSMAYWGSFVSLPYKNLSQWQAFKMSIPFVWADWIFLTKAFELFHKYSLFSPTRLLFIRILFHFTGALIINKFYLKQTIHFSDIVAILLLFSAYVISELHLFSKLVGLPINKKSEQEESEESLDLAIKNPIININTITSHIINRKEPQYTLHITPIEEVEAEEDLIKQV